MEAYPGKYVVIARKDGDTWYLGALAGTEAYHLSLKLDFLDQETLYLATIFSDDPSLNTPTKVAIRENEYNHQSLLEEHIRDQNGLAVIFTPIHTLAPAPD